MNTVLPDDDDYIDDYLSSCPPAIDQDVRYFLLSSVSKYRQAGMGIMMTQSAKSCGPDTEGTQTFNSTPDSKSGCSGGN
ncbi:hypothetical protein CDAR_476951 [Caerostris darwini]|uniref:Uncharacterized protein n=1 Tax=Caerostris darwini TaxID=1538125 RepID=A0AAV4TPM2_9ARAC|nr:hypothetical protein CDAR_476951 [Caerostris darwini]